MKKLIVVLGMLSITACGTSNQDSSMTKSVAGADMMTTEVSCVDNAAGADKGYRVEITSGGIAGLTLAKVSESWIGGVRNVATVGIQRQDSAMERIYTGDQFSLDIGLESFAPTTHHPAKLQFTKNGEAVSASVTCTFN